MKKYLLLFALILGSIISKGQDLKEVIKLVYLTQYEKAKPEIDKFLSDEKNAGNAEGWYYKAFIYNSLGRVETKPTAERKSLLLGALSALKKYRELDPKATLAEENKNGAAFNIYSGLYDLGAKTYNEQNFTESFEYFKKALEVHDYIYSLDLTGTNGYKFSALDTGVVWNLAFLANDLKLKDEGEIYYKKIVEADLSDEKYVLAYDEVIKKYRKEKNAELFNKYMARAQKYFPADKSYWENVDIEFAVADVENQALLNKFEELTVKYPDNYMVHFNYAIEVDQFLNSANSKGVNAPLYRNKIIDLYKKALSLKSTIEVNLQLATIYYNQYFEILERIGRIPGTKPTELKLKKELTDSSKALLHTCIPYAQEAVKQLAELKAYKYSDKANYKLALEILEKAYRKEGDEAKAAEYEKRRGGVDKL